MAHLIWFKSTRIEFFGIVLCVKMFHGKQTFREQYEKIRLTKLYNGNLSHGKLCNQAPLEVEIMKFEPFPWKRTVTKQTLQKHERVKLGTLFEFEFELVSHLIVRMEKSSTEHKNMGEVVSNFPREKGKQLG